MNTPTRVSIDRVGRMVIPKEIRDEAGIEPGMSLVISCREGRIEIEPERRPIRIVKKGRLQIAESVEEAEPLTAATVRKTQARVRSEED
jgi:AbrB family looped-hinge helix DNA binding protein